MLIPKFFSKIKSQIWPVFADFQTSKNEKYNVSYDFWNFLVTIGYKVHNKGYVVNLILNVQYFFLKIKVFIEQKLKKTDE